MYIQPTTLIMIDNEEANFQVILCIYLGNSLYHYSPNQDYQVENLPDGGGGGAEKGKKKDSLKSKLIT